MKKGIRVFVVLLLAVAVIASYSVPADVYAAGTTKKPKADAVEYYTNSEGDKTGIKTITILPYTYYNINGDTKDPKTVELNDATIQKIAAEQIFPRWGVIAEGIFRDQANQLVTIEGSGMMSSDKSPSNSFDRHFSQTRSGVSGHNYSWGLNDLAKELGTPEPKSKHNTAEQSEFAILQGSTNNDEVVYSGLFPINNLKEARNLMGKSLRACADDNDLTVDDFLGNGKDKSGNEYRLPDLDNDKTDGGYCNVVTCVNRAGDSADYDYVCFGLAVYDFDVTPIAASDLSYIHAAQDYADEPDPIKAAAEAHAEGVAYSDDPHSTDTFATNKSSQESTTSVSLTSEESEEIGSTTEESFEWGMEQEIGADVGIGPGSDNFARVTLHFQQNFHELWNTMKGSSQTKSKREERTVNQELVLPGHTAANIKQTNNTSTAWQSYQQPVVLNYKVAVFAMSGDYYNGWGGMISASRYDKEWLSVLFDGSDGCEPGGCNALASLQNRAIVNADTDGYDRTKGKYKSWCDKSAWKYNTKINWNNIASTLAGDNRDTHTIPNYKGEKSSLKDLASQLLFAETARKFTRDRKIMTSEVSSLMPLYNLASVDITSKNRNFEVRTGDRLYLDGIELGGFDKDNVEFYGFDSGLGAWTLSDDDAVGASTDDGGSVTKVTTADGYLTLNTDKQTGSQWVTISSEQTTADKVYHLVWEVDKSKKITTMQSVDEEATHPDSVMTEEELEAVETPSLGVSVKSDTANVKSIEVSGSYTGPYDQEINLNKELDVTVQNTDGGLMSIPIYWEDNGVRPAEVHESGEAKFSTPGTYKVRAYSLNNGQKITSNWIDIEAKAKPALKKIDFSVPSLDEDLLTLTKKYNTRSYDLNSYLKFYDQYGETWEGTREDPLPTIRFSLDDEDGAVIENGVLTVSKAGTYTVTAKAYDGNGNLLSYAIPSLKFKVTEDRWLDSIEFNEPAVGKNDLKLQSVDDQITIGGLKDLLCYYDQNGKPMELTAGETPKVTFRLTGEPEGAEIRSGGGYTFFAYKPGVYTIQPVIDGYSVNPITIEVTEARYLVIETIDPVKQPITEYGGSVTVDLDKYVNATTQFGGSWKDGVPAMNYTLDAGVTGAAIGEKDGIENAFVSDTPGKYIVHVAPKKASAYTADIDDIEITVVKQSRVQAVGMDFLVLSPEQRTVPTQAQAEEPPADETDGQTGEPTGDTNDTQTGDTTGDQPEPLLIDPSQCIAYYDQFGERIKTEDLAGLKLPKISGYTINTESFENNKATVELTEVDGKPMLAAKTAGICEVTPILADEGYEAQPGYLFLIDEETGDYINEAAGELIKAYFDVCAYHAKDAEQVVSDGLNIIAAANSKEAADSLLSMYKDKLKKYGHAAGTPVKENINFETGAYEKVIYCTNCGAELHREAKSAPVDISGAAVTVKNVTYNGKKQTPAVTVRAGDVTLTKGTDYTLTYKNNTAAGKATVTAKGIGDYTGSVSKAFTIYKKANTLKVSGKKVTVKYKNVKKKAQILGVTKVIKFTNKGQGAKTYVKKSGNKKITINKKTGKVTVKKKLKKGTYKVKVKVTAAGSANYKKSAVKIVTLTIIIK